MTIRDALLTLLVMGVFGVAQLQLESNLGHFPVPPVVGMTGESCGSLIASGRVSSADHETTEGYFEIGAATLMLHPLGIPVQIVRGLKDQPVELWIRRVEPRAPKKLER